MKDTDSSIPQHQLRCLCSSIRRTGTRVRCLPVQRMNRSGAPHAHTFEVERGQSRAARKHKGRLTACTRALQFAPYRPP